MCLFENQNETVLTVLVVLESPEQLVPSVPHKCNPIPSDIGEYIAIDDSLLCGLIWIKQPSRTGPKVIGKPAGNFSGGYYKFGFRYKKYHCHRVIQFLLTGEDPGDKYVDHREDKSNTGTNLRLATPQQNQFNKISLPNSTSKYKGLYWNKQANKWQAQITSNRKVKGLGLYLNELDAAYAYNIAALIVFGEYARLNELPSDYDTNLFQHKDKVIKKANELLDKN